MTPKRAWLAVQILGLLSVTAGVVLLAGLAWALVEAGLVLAVVGEVRS